MKRTKRFMSMIFSLLMICSIVFVMNDTTIVSAEESKQAKEIVIEEIEESLGSTGYQIAAIENYGFTKYDKESSVYKITFGDGSATEISSENCPAAKELDKLVEEINSNNDGVTSTYKARWEPIVYDTKNHIVELILWNPFPYKFCLVNSDGSYVEGLEGVFDDEESVDRFPAREETYAGNTNKETILLNDDYGLVVKDPDVWPPHFELKNLKTDEILMDDIRLEYSTNWCSSVLVGSKSAQVFFVFKKGNTYKIYFKDAPKEEATEKVTVSNDGLICNAQVGTDNKTVSAKAPSNTIPSDSMFTFAIPESTSSQVVAAKNEINKFIAANKPEGSTAAALSDSAFVWDINLLKADSVIKIQPTNGGKVTITLPKPDGLSDTVVVYRFDGENIKALEATVEDGKVSFETDHFSYFVIDNKLTNENNASGTENGTGGNSTDNGTGESSTDNGSAGTGTDNRNNEEDSIVNTGDMNSFVLPIIFIVLSLGCLIACLRKNCKIIG